MRPTEPAPPSPRGGLARRPAQAGPAGAPRDAPARDITARDTHDNPARDTHDNPTRDTHDNPTRDTHDNPTRDTHDNPARDTHDNPARDTHDNPARDTHDITPRPIHLPPDAVLRMLRPLIAQEAAAHLGRAPHPAEAEAWPDDLPLGEGGLGLDSLGAMAAGAALDRLFQLHETGAEGLLLLDRRLSAWAGVVTAALAHGTSGLVFATSGSTGAPRPCFHPWAALQAEAAFWARRFRGRRRILLAAPAHHIYGAMFGVLLPLALGVPALARRGATPAALARELAAGDLLVAVPAQLRPLAAAGAPLPPGLRIVSSTAPLPPPVAAALRRLGADCVTEVHGSSETGGIGWRDAAEAPFRLLPRWRPGAGGEDATVTEAAAGAMVPLPDRVAWQADGRYRPLGRKDLAVQVMGTNVWPRRVEAVLRAHPAVAEAAVRLDLGLVEPRLKAFVVPHRGTQAGAEAGLAEALRGWCAERLAPAERPLRIALGPALPVTDTGKAADWPDAA